MIVPVPGNERDSATVQPPDDEVVARLAERSVDRHSLCALEEAVESRPADDSDTRSAHGGRLRAGASRMAPTRGIPSRSVDAAVSRTMAVDNPIVLPRGSCLAR